MVALVIGLLFVGAAVFAVVPGLPLNWGAQVIAFLQGGAPVLAGFIGLLAILIGIADIKDRIEAKKEEAAESKEENKSPNA